MAKLKLLASINGCLLLTHETTVNTASAQHVTTMVVKNGGKPENMKRKKDWAVGTLSCE